MTGIDAALRAALGASASVIIAPRASLFLTVFLVLPLVDGVRAGVRQGASAPISRRCAEPEALSAIG